MQSVFIDPQTLQISGTGVQVEYDPYIVDPATANVVLVGNTITLVPDQVKIFEKNMKIVRTQRDIFLAECDWTQLPDVNIPNKSAWAAYRQALRDLPGSVTDPGQITWPVPPK